MKNLFAFYVLLFFSCSTTDEINRSSKIKTEDRIESVEQLFSYNVRVREEIMRRKGFRKKEQGEKLGPNVYDVKDGKTLTNDIEILKWIIKVHAFSIDLLITHPSNYYLFKINTERQANISCLTNNPFLIKNENTEKYFTRKISKVEDKTEIFEKYDEIPWIDDTITTNEATVKKHCLPFNPNNRFAGMDRKTLLEKFFMQFGGRKMLCETFENPQDDSIYKNKCEVIEKKERNDIIYAMIEKGFRPILDTGQIFLYLPKDDTILFSDKHIEHFLFY
jgi:hypothetical protein